MRAPQRLQKNLGMPEEPDLPKSVAAIYYANAG
jgi:hypothetical protein